MISTKQTYSTQFESLLKTIVETFSSKRIVTFRGKTQKGSHYCHFSWKDSKKAIRVKYTRQNPDELCHFEPKKLVPTKIFSKIPFNLDYKSLNHRKLTIKE